MIELEFHPVADIFPMMSDQETADLVADIAANGLRVPIWLHRDGRIIDGRNRYLACREVGHEPETRTYEGDDADLIPFVVSLNLHRRHLSESHRAMVAARIATLTQGRPRNPANLQDFDPLIEEVEEPSPVQEVPQISRTSAAELMNVSERSVASAHTVIAQGVPELAEAVMAGDVAVSTAADLALAPQEEQREVLATGNRKQIREHAKVLRMRRRSERDVPAPEDPDPCSEDNDAPASALFDSAEDRAAEDARLDASLAAEMAESANVFRVNFRPKLTSAHEMARTTSVERVAQVYGPLGFERDALLRDVDFIEAWCQRISEALTKTTQIRDAGVNR